MLLVRSKPQVLLIINGRGLNMGFTHRKALPSTQLKKRYVSYILICNIYVLKTIIIFNYAELLNNSLLWKILFITCFLLKPWSPVPWRWEILGMQHGPGDNCVLSTNRKLVRRCPRGVCTGSSTETKVQAQGSLKLF